MINIRETLKVPSAAIQSVIDGLEHQSKRDDFKINMRTFGEVDGNICFGCMATCSIQEVAKRNLSLDNIHHSLKRANALDMDQFEIIYFENAIDSLRCGRIGALMAFFGHKYEDSPEIKAIFTHIQVNPFTIHTNTWREEIHHLKTLIYKLQKIGL